jgi:hypothetical protein
MDSDFQCRMRQPHPKIGIILFFVRCRMRQTHPTLKIPVRVNRPLQPWWDSNPGSSAQEADTTTVQLIDILIKNDHTEKLKSVMKLNCRFNLDLKVLIDLPITI